MTWCVCEGMKVLSVSSEQVASRLCLFYWLLCVCGVNGTIAIIIVRLLDKVCSTASRAWPYYRVHINI